MPYQRSPAASGVKSAGYSRLEAGDCSGAKLIKVLFLSLCTKKLMQRLVLLLLVEHSIWKAGAETVESGHQMDQAKHRSTNPQPRCSRLMECCT